jgi:capsid protein
MSKNYIEAVPLASIDSATFTGNYLPINGAGLTEACSLIRITNDSNVDITISYDGATPHDYLRAGDKLELNLQANSQPNGYMSFLKQGQVVYVLAAPGIGYVYLAGYFNPKN